MMAIEFGIEDRRVADDVHVMAVTGEIDLFTAPEFKQHLSQPIDDGVDRLIVDLSGTTFIDSSSLGVLIGAHRRLTQRAGSVVVTVCVTSGDAGSNQYTPPEMTRAALAPIREAE